MGTGLQLFSNNAGTATLAAGISNTATSLSVTSGEGAEFPALSAGQFFVATLMHIVGGVVSGAVEIITVTARSTDSMTIVRGQEGTTAAAWSAGDTLALLWTAGGASQMVQPVQAQAQSYNYAIDTGVAGAYVVGLTPALTARVAGMPIRFLAGHANAGASTFNDGNGAQPLVLANGSYTPPGTIVAGGIYTATWNSTLSAFQLSGYSGIIGTQTAGFTFVGFSANPAVSIGYALRDGVCSLILSISLGTSNGNTFEIHGLTSIVAPLAPSVIVPVVGLVDNGAQIAGGAVQISSGGVLQFWKDGTSNATWTASGNKGASQQLGITYPIILT